MRDRAFMHVLNVGAFCAFIDARVRVGSKNFVLLSGKSRGKMRSRVKWYNGGLEQWEMCAVGSCRSCTNAYWVLLACGCLSPPPPSFRDVTIISSRMRLLCSGPCNPSNILSGACIAPRASATFSHPSVSWAWLVQTNKVHFSCTYIMSYCLPWCSAHGPECMLQCIQSEFYTFFSLLSHRCSFAFVLSQLIKVSSASAVEHTSH